MNVKPINTKMEILIAQEHKVTNEKILYCRRAAPIWLATGIGLFIVSITLLILSLFSGYIVKFLFIGIFFGLSFAIKGLSLYRDAREVKFFSDRKVEELISTNNDITQQGLHSMTTQSSPAKGGQSV